jgi:ribosomal protein L2
MLYFLDKSFINLKLQQYSSISNKFLNRAKKYLIIGFSNKSGRNMYGNITVFTKGGRSKFKLRILDFKRILFSKGIILSKERD